MAAPEIPDFFAALQGGDQRAVEELLGQLDPCLRRVIRLRLIGGRLRQAVDTTDVLQSLLKDFLARTGKETPPPRRAGGLCAFLAAAGAQQDSQKAAHKERRHAGSLPDDWDTVSPDPSPAQIAERRDLCRVVQARLPEDKRLLFDLKVQGLTWTQIAEHVGGQSDALRLGLCRGIAKILSDLGDEESSDAG